jgi:hypothetical protein
MFQVEATVGLIGRTSGPIVPRQCSAQALEERPRLRVTDPAVPAMVAAGELRVELQGVFGQPLFVCTCGRRTRDLYRDGAGAWICRRCGRWDYQSRHSWETAELRQVAKLRRRLGADPSVLVALPARPKARGAARRYDRLVLRIRVAEARALAATQHFTGAVARMVEEDLT